MSKNNLPSLLSEQDFVAACSALPLVSIDLMLTYRTQDSEVLLLGMRNNRPARDFWFSPGGRIRKNEGIQLAMQRIASEELGMPLSWLSRATLLGAWDHFYDDSAFSDAVSTHYVNLAYRVPVSREEIGLLCPPCGALEQHSAWKWFPLDVASSDESVHENVRVVASLMQVRCDEAR
ncbi:NUDIX domain-containing protein [Vogesella sp. XCS3]|uniref:NUDIX domain-containing protein n=1 Tax=Vogesella sp. XCS3 TaxID=2877939 RepID=UPI001D0A089D|nr:NUDIX domain-containing protein [Vogesella sp. XCS3]UDM16709.1 NUDIX domain-containing protein [Vogesella sp. XCS3]